MIHLFQSKKQAKVVRMAEEKDVEPIDEVPSTEPAPPSLDPCLYFPAPGPPHEALFLALPYLPAAELLAASEVCLSLRDAAVADVLPWLDTIVEGPLSRKLCDETLQRLASRAKGRMRALALVNCAKVTDYGLLRVAQQNPLIEKLHVPGCTALTPEGMIEVVKMLTKNNHRLKSLRIQGIYNIKKEHLETLGKCLLVNSPQQECRTFRNRSISALAESKRVIDVGVCPKCSEVRMVYGCSGVEACKWRKKQPWDDCVGCIFCVPRCSGCGACVEVGEREEVVCCEEFLCSDCWLQLPKCSLCNKPYCRQHAYLQHRKGPESPDGFICHVCHDGFSYWENDL